VGIGRIPTGTYSDGPDRNEEELKPTMTSPWPAVIALCMGLLLLGSAALIHRHITPHNRRVARVIRGPEYEPSLMGEWVTRVWVTGLFGFGGVFCIIMGLAHL
jgi:hypothetical protein